VEILEEILVLDETLSKPLSIFFAEFVWQILPLGHGVWLLHHCLMLPRKARENSSPRTPAPMVSVIHVTIAVEPVIRGTCRNAESRA
jgi:hypothetical protein